MTASATPARVSGNRVSGNDNGGRRRSHHIPDVLPWERRGSVDTIPGGYSGYLKSLRQICQRVEDHRPPRESLVGWIREEFKISDLRARILINTLRKVGFVNEGNSGLLSVGELATRWLKRGDNGTTDDNFEIVALLHSRVSFVGEMMAELLQHPRSVEELRKTANDRYGQKWETPASVNIRRGWLESAGLVRQDDERRLVLTDAGERLLPKLDLRKPDELPEAPARAPAQSIEQESVERASGTERASGAADTDGPAREAAGEAPADEVAAEDEVLSKELLEASFDSGNASRFEIAVRDAFGFLGFEATHLGGPGKTDVLVIAPLGRDNSYRVAVDAKTTKSGSLSDHQIDWVTLRDHRRNHKADYSLIVGPDPAGDRLMERAVEHGVAVMSAAQLAGLCRRHSDAPVGLNDYVKLFEPGEVDVTEVEEKIENSVRLRGLAAKVFAILASRTSEMGAMSARELWMLLDYDSRGLSSEAEIEEILKTLSHPLVGALRAVEARPEARYIQATTPKVCRVSLHNLARELVDGPGSDPMDGARSPG